MSSSLPVACYALLFLKKCLLHFLLLVMLFAHVAKPSNSRSQISLKQMFLKTRNVHRKTPVLELHFNKVSVLEGLHFF